MILDFSCPPGLHSKYSSYVWTTRPLGTVVPTSSRLTGLGFGTLNLRSRSWSEDSDSFGIGRFQAEILDQNLRVLCLYTPAGNVPPSAEELNTAQPLSIMFLSWYWLSNGENGTFTQSWFQDTHWSAMAEVLQSKTFI